MDQGKKVIVSGCVPQGKPDAEYIKGLSIIGVQQIDRVVEVVEETLKGAYINKDTSYILFFYIALYFVNINVLISIYYLFSGNQVRLFGQKKVIVSEEERENSGIQSDSRKGGVFFFWTYLFLRTEKH